MSSSRQFLVRPYQPSDEIGWLRCRVLSFLDTQYYDDVKIRRTVLAESSIALVAVTPAGEIVGILDIETDGDAGTIDTIATHPDHQGVGIATALLEASLSRLDHDNIATLDAWTREDIAANRWYQSKGFAENYRYLHVYLSDGDDHAGFTAPDGLSRPISVFTHGKIEDEIHMRTQFQRVYVCRQYIRPITMEP